MIGSNYVHQHKKIANHGYNNIEAQPPLSICGGEILKFLLSYGGVKSNFYPPSLQEKTNLATDFSDRSPIQSLKYILLSEGD